jgi:selenobiotic family peptide radical SAM maturase
MKRPLADIFSICARLADPSAWQSIEKSGQSLRTSEAACKLIQRRANEGNLPPWMGDLARIELARHRMSRHAPSPPPAELRITPDLQLIPVSWQGLPLLLDNGNPGDVSPGERFVLVWRHPLWGSVLKEEALAADLLVLKMTAEGLSAEEAAAACGVPPGGIENHIRQGIRRGILDCPPSSLRREKETFDPGKLFTDDQLIAPVFTLQWHITQRCDLHCRHCYDRSDRRDVELAEGLRILDQLRSFCLTKHVQGQVSFSGGNPFLHPHFTELYQAAVDRGFMTAILGNPTGRKELENILSIRKPAYYQVSLEGRQGLNDEIRGEGHYERTLAFLRLLRRLDVPSMVMLTLTRRNMEDIIPLGRELEGLTDGLAFNRLALVGEGARLQLPTPEEYNRFLHDYVEALAEVPVLALKDNLLNTVFQQRGNELFCGCAGYGCGAAFNFLALLPDGEIHACRKFPSPVGTLAECTLTEIYDAPLARRYREGSAACSGCRLRAVCGGCLAITRSLGLDPFTDRDPFCLDGPLALDGRGR